MKLSFFSVLRLFAAGVLSLTFGLTAARAQLAVPAITSEATANGGAGRPFAFNFTATNSPTSFTVSGLPAGLTVFTASGAMFGPLPAPGVYTITVRATNAAGTGPSSTLTITVGNVPEITSGSAADSAVGSAFTYFITAINSPTSYAAAGLPPGLSLSTATGEISGTPTAAGTFAVSLTAANVSGPSDAHELTLTISGPPAPAPVIATHPVSQSVSTGGNATFTVVATDALTYQWNKDGVAIVNATASSLIISGVKVSDAGSYAVTATGPGGSVTSKAATLAVVAVVVPPVITAQPETQTVLFGGSVTFRVAASSAAAPSYQWQKDGVAIAGATSATLTLNSVVASSAGNYSVVISNSGGAVTSSAVALTVAARSIVGSYLGAFGGNGGSFALYVRADRTGVFLGYARGAKIALISRDVVVDAGGRFRITTTSAVSTAPASVAGAAAADATYVIDGTIAIDGSLSGSVSGLNLTLAAPAAATTGATATAAGFYQAGAAGTSATSYMIVDADGHAFVVTVTSTAADAGAGSVGADGVVTVNTEDNTQIAGSIQSQAATVSLTAKAGSTEIRFVGANRDVRTEVEQLLNISARSQTGAASNVLIAGFVIAGAQPRPVLVRAIGPSLAQFGVSSALSAARLEVISGATSVAVGTDWGAAANASTIAATTTRVGAFPLATNSRDAVLLLTLAPGSYTAIVTGQNSATGVSLVEVYDATIGPIPNTQRVINISSRAAVGAGDATLIGGFYISGTVPKRMLIRGVGPALTQFGLPGALARPQLVLFRGNQTVAQNSGWSTSPDAAAIATAATQGGAFAFSAGSQDAAILIYLEPGAYTAQVSGVGGTAGIALIEIYDLP